MLQREHLKDLLSKDGLSKRDKAVLLLAVEPYRAKTVSEIRTIALSVGLREVEKWNVSDVLGKGAGLIIRTDKGWELTGEGRKRAHELAEGVLKAPAIVQVARDLRAHVDALGNSAVKDFLREAISCFEAGLYRAAVVFSWVGAVALLQEHVHAKHLAAFNAEVRRRDAKWRDAKTVDDLNRLKEYDFLNVLEALSIISKNTKQQLEERLKLRNACGHPSSLKISTNAAAAHIEVLLLNVFNKF